MAVGNSISRTGANTAPKATTTNEVSYETGGETVKLSPALIRRYLVRGGGEVTDEEVMAFLSLCRFQHLNPFINEAYLIKYGNNSPATMVVGKDVFLKRARAEKDFRGFTAGIIVIDNDGIISEREGAFWVKGQETLLGGWAKVVVADFETPFYSSVTIDDYAGRKKDGTLNGQWATKAATMIRKVALVQALRDAYPNMSGMYAAEERADAVPPEIVAEAADVTEPAPRAAAPQTPPPEIIRTDTPIPPRQEAREPQQTAQQYSFGDDPEAALFGGLQ